MYDVQRKCHTVQRTAQRLRSLPLCWWMRLDPVCDLSRTCGHTLWIYLRVCYGHSLRVDTYYRHTIGRNGSPDRPAVGTQATHTRPPQTVAAATIIPSGLGLSILPVFCSFFDRLWNRLKGLIKVLAPPPCSDGQFTGGASHLIGELVIANMEEVSTCAIGLQCPWFRFVDWSDSIRRQVLEKLI